MGKFVFGLIVGIIVGALAVMANPNLPEELRVSLANLTAQVMRGAGETAEDLGNAAENLADEPGQADTEPPAATDPATPADRRGAGEPQ